MNNPAQQNKKLVWQYWQTMNGRGNTDSLTQFLHPDTTRHGFQPLRHLNGLAASTGWPNLAGTHRNDYMGWAPTGQKIGWDIMDFWKRDGDLLLENWVLIDLIGAAQESGVDLLATLPQLKKGL
jgi:hypothetical protein